ncbi:PLP-dependent transferase [Auricularia subglabra TFB-10046 SS5]|nr:PLP-dependent transferase [Auricularia subglabra TFB-10046 SS5]
MKREFNMAESYVNLNHGSYGTVPSCVIEYAEKLGRQCDTRPDLWWRRTADPLIVEARESVANLLNVDVDECVLVINTTAGINHVLRNIHWKAGDVIVANSTTYDSVSLMMQYHQDIEPGLELSYLDWSFPMSRDEIVAKFRAHLQSIKRHEGQKIIAIIDALPSAPGILLPWERMVQVCKEENVWSLIDAAHAIGQVHVDLKVVDPDFWISNCHKWLYARRGCAVFYVPKRQVLSRADALSAVKHRSSNQHLITTSFPTSFAYKRPQDVPQPYEPGVGAKNNFVMNFSPVLMNATMDFVPFISVIEAIRFRQDVGGEKAIQLYCHLLALRGGRRMAEIFGTHVMDPDGSLTANMVNVRLPLAVRSQQTKADLGARKSFFKERMLMALDCAVQTYTHNGTWWFRASAQIFNEISDFEYAANHVKKMCEAFAAEDEEKWGKP